MAVFIVATAAVAGWFHVSGYGMFRDLWATWSEEAELKTQIDEIEKRNRKLEQEIEDLAPGGPGIEKTVREDLGWSKKDEIVIRIPGKK